MATPASGAASSESVVCADGWKLDVIVRAPPGAPRAVAVCGHAMMVDRRTLDVRGAGLVSALVDAGIAVVWPDLRGHGQSGPLAARGGRWSYDDLVEQDTPALYALARARFPGLALYAVGHSLFGHVALAHRARHPEARLDGLVLIAATAWLRACERSWLVWLEKRALLASMSAIARAVGYFPARALRQGTNDEAADYAVAFATWASRGDWCARDGFSWWAALPDVRTPLLAIAGAGDRLLAEPADARAFVARVPGAVFRVAGRALPADDRIALDFDPGHMQLVTDARSRPVWQAIARFIVAPGGE